MSQWALGYRSGWLGVAAPPAAAGEVAGTACRQCHGHFAATCVCIPVKAMVCISRSESSGVQVTVTAWSTAAAGGCHGEGGRQG